MAKNSPKSLDFGQQSDQSTAQPGRNHLLLIGIDRYQHVGQLNNAVRDAQAFGRLLQDKYQFDADHITALYDQQATGEAIARAFRQLIGRVKPGDNLVVYFSGHGHYDTVLEEGYWVPVEARFQAEREYVSYDYLKKVIKAIKSQHTVFIVDSCYSGAVFVRGKDLKAERFERDPSRWMIASGRNEVVPDGVAGGNSPFAEHLLDLLDRYSLEGLRLGTLVERLTTSVTYNSRQTPIGRPMYEVGDKGGEFVFRPKRNQQADLEAAQQAGTAQALQNFLQAYPDYPQKAEVESGIAQLQDDEAWTVTKQRHTIEAYRDYRQRFPQGRHRHEALQWMGQIEAEREWARAQRLDTLVGYEAFIDRYPDSPNRAAAEAAVERLLPGSTPSSATSMPGSSSAEVGQGKGSRKAPRPRPWRWATLVATPLILFGLWRGFIYQPVVPDDSQSATMTEDTISQAKLGPGQVGSLPLPRMIRISGGSYEMGSEQGNEDEQPVHVVRVSDFYLSETEVTFAQYDYFCDQTGYSKPTDEGWGRGTRPVINVSWEDAQAYCQWVSQQTEQTFRLPTEAEWEYAAGGGAANRHTYAGTSREDSLGTYAVYQADRTSPVKTKRPNGLGLYDMSGNVWEWCSDWHATSYYAEGPSQDPEGPRSGHDRALRGGSWAGQAEYCRVAVRGRFNPSYRLNYLGFRLAHAAPAPESE